MISNWSSIPSLRLDKYLYLVRVYISHTFLYLSGAAWSQELLEDWSALITGKGDCQGVLDPHDPKVGDGLRYHILDVWVDGLLETDDWERGLERGILKPIESVAAESWTKTLRERARSVIDDEQIRDIQNRQGIVEGDTEDTGDSFEGFED